MFKKLPMYVSHPVGREEMRKNLTRLAFNLDSPIYAKE
jgi:hypothetical protein